MFLGREKELKMLSDYYNSNTFEFSVIHFSSEIYLHIQDQNIYTRGN
jgi:hypothetical protein